MKTYVTVQGDMWDSIAHRQLGSTNHTGRLMEANLEHIGMYIFPAGVVLKLPEIPEEVTSSLPPWKRVTA